MLVCMKTRDRTKKAKTPAPAAQLRAEIEARSAGEEIRTTHHEITTRIGRLLLKGRLGSESERLEAAISLGVLLGEVELALYELALWPGERGGTESRDAAGMMLARHYAEVLRDVDAARKRYTRGTTSKAWKLSHGVEGAPANAEFVRELARPARRSKSQSNIARWISVTINMAADAHGRGERKHGAGIRSTDGLHEFGSREDEKEAWRVWCMGMLERKFKRYVEQPDYLREQAAGTPAPTWRNHAGTSALRAFEKAWGERALRHATSSKT
jgi:hypothetical protein